MTNKTTVSILKKVALTLALALIIVVGVGIINKHSYRTQIYNGCLGNVQQSSGIKNPVRFCNCIADRMEEVNKQSSIKYMPQPMLEMLMVQNTLICGMNS